MNNLSLLISFFISFFHLQAQDNIVYRKKLDQGKSKIEFLTDKTYGTQGTKITDTRFEVIETIKGGKNECYIGKIHAETIRFFGHEGQKKEFTVKMTPLAGKGNTLDLRFKCDELFFDTDRITTVKFGCCGAPFSIGIQNYKNEKIIEGDVSILEGNRYTFPTIYASFIGKDSADRVGSFFFNNGKGQSYEIQVLTSLDMNKIYTESFDINVLHPQTKQYLDLTFNPYRFISTFNLFQVDSSTNGTVNCEFTIQFKFYDGSLIGNSQNITKTITIPIIESLPFGKVELVQQLFLN